MHSLKQYAFNCEWDSVEMSWEEQNVFDTIYNLIIYGTELFDIIASFVLREFPFWFTQSM